MMNILSIENFKSIKKIEIEYDKVNVFIGEPNTGKSNILEAIGFLSGLRKLKLNEFVRYRSLTHLYHFFEVSKDIMISDEDIIVTFRYMKDRDDFQAYLSEGENLSEEPIGGYMMNGNLYSQENIELLKNKLERYKFYNFLKRDTFDKQQLNFLNPPDGSNLSSIILTNMELREHIMNIFYDFGYQFIIEEPERSIKFLLQTKNLNLLIPYNILSDTLQRMIFYLSAIYSNNDSIIAFNEPESKAFPYYTRTLAELIAMDKNNNKYFISTHNPYFLITVIEKCDLNDINVFITYLDNYITKIKKLNEEELSDILTRAKDPFFNIHTYIT